MMARRLASTALALLLSIVPGPAALGAAPRQEPVFRVEVKLTALGVTIGQIERQSGIVMLHRDFPQLSRYFFEVTGAKGEVLYANSFSDPRTCFVEPPPRGSGSTAAPGGTVLRQAATTWLVVPATDDAREISVFRRERSQSGQHPRVLLAKGALR